MQKLMKEALNGNQLDDRYLFVLDYLSTVVGFQNASDQKTKDSFLIQLGKNEERGHSLGFDREELSSLNFLVLQVKTGGQLPVLEQRIKKKFQ
ncbi:MAG: hypothetical protein ABIB55_00525 [Candidatus Nealsonbacteria bacterium]